MRISTSPTIPDPHGLLLLLQSSSDNAGDKEERRRRRRSTPVLSYEKFNGRAAKALPSNDIGAGALPATDQRYRSKMARLPVAPDSGHCVPVSI